MIRHLDDEVSHRVLLEGRVGRLGCMTEAGPYVVPISYYYDGNSVYMHSPEGKKIEALRADPRTCIQVDEISDIYHWRSVIAFGHYNEVTDPKERDFVMNKMLRRFPHLTPAESLHENGSSTAIIVFRIRVSKVTGVAEE